MKRKIVKVMVMAIVIFIGILSYFHLSSSKLEAGEIVVYGTWNERFEECIGPDTNCCDVYYVEDGDGSGDGGEN